MGLDNPLHILILLLVVLLVFGAKRLPEIGRSLGEGMRGFKDSISGESHQHSLTPAPPAAPPVAAAPAPEPAVAPAPATVAPAAPAPAPAVTPPAPVEDAASPTPSAG
jgi:sec-independent protein translocase protein TatA